MDMFRRTFAEIDLDALAGNVRRLRAALSPRTFFCPMVKANAYGHGDVGIARALEKQGVRHLGVCLIEEGLLLRQAGIQSDILVFRGFDRAGAEQILRHRMKPVVSTWEQIEDLEALATGAVNVHLKFDTGMNRLGFSTGEAQKLFDRFWQNPKLRVEGLLTHLWNGEDAGQADGDSAAQLRALRGAADRFKALSPMVHALNSAGIVHRLDRAGEKADPSHPLEAMDWGCRPGLMIYGSNPVRPGFGCELEPVMNLRSHVAVYRTLAPGEGVSYGHTWKASRDSVIAVVPIGYADGYHRLLSNRASALFAGERAPVVGTICMDYLMLDVTDAVKKKNLSPEKDQEVTLFGRSREGVLMPAEELATHAGTIPWEIFTSVGERVPRVYKGGAA
ncbi:MAG: alanine racemase [Bdellovibrionaceae bacterium]|nr:alanine racemase [Pseudobdellovibrionaceae bacterium]